MTRRRTPFLLRLAALLAASLLRAAAAEYHGSVTFAGQPVPGATVTATQGAKHLSTLTDPGGLYTFPDLAAGPWHISVAMQLFAPASADITVPTTPAGRFALTLLPLNELLTRTQITTPTNLPAAPQPTLAVKPKSDAPEIPRPPDENAQRANDGFLINGSSNNAATSQYSLAQAFGNKRSGTKSLYTGGLAFIFDNSATDARQYSVTGLDSPKPAYNRITGIFTIGGPINIPHLLPHGPNFFLAYQGTRGRTAVIEPGLVPTAAERTGDLSGLPNTTLLNPVTGLPFANNLVPVSPQARALLALYPLPNLAGNTRYNYQVPVLNSSHEDDLESRLDKTLGHRDQLYGGVSFHSVRASSASLFAFNDTTDTLGLNSNINWSHRFSARLFGYLGYRFSRLRTQVIPNFENRANISGLAGISGNDQDPANYGPPTLNFSSGITSLADAQSSFNRNRTDAFNVSAAIYRGRHNITLGGDLRKQQFNDFFQQDPRGTFAFTGAATGNDLADFLTGIPDTSSIAFGNPDKYLRQPVYDLYANDDFRVIPTLTLNYGLRWEYGAPITETKNRLVNLDLTPGFTAASPVLASSPIGPLTGQHLPTSLVRPDRLGFEPRVGISWRPIPASTVVVRAGYGIYHDTSVYQQPALQLAQQSPLSKTLSVQNSAACPLTLANGFAPCNTTTPNTFAIDPNFRVGFAQTWQVAIQRDLPAALQATVTYLGVKGSNGVQQSLPNTYAIGAPDPCPSCPSGYIFRSSNGTSLRNSGQLQLRRRLRSGFTATALYTFSKSVDDDAVLGGQGHVTSGSQSTNPTEGTASIAQNWQDLRAERARSTFDQRHLLNLNLQYTSGQGLGGGDLFSGWRGRLLKEWTIATTAVAGSGLPETPLYFATIQGAAYTNVLRPNPTGAPLYISSAGLHLNAAAFAPPLAGHFGTAGRNSITGPTQFTLNTSLARTFRAGGRYFLDLRVDSTNLLNHVAFTAWATTINSTQFGLPLAANPMRSLQTTLRLRF